MTQFTTRRKADNATAKGSNRESNMLRACCLSSSVELRDTTRLKEIPRPCALDLINEPSCQEQQGNNIRASRMHVAASKLDSATNKPSTLSSPPFRQTKIRLCVCWRDTTRCRNLHGASTCYVCACAYKSTSRHMSHACFSQHTRRYTLAEWLAIVSTRSSEIVGLD